MSNNRSAPPPIARSFPPLANTDADILILGSMPGEASLAAQQYYAHPRNAFWPIMAELLHFEASAPYPRRVAALQSERIALWDVLHSCTRPGSLDANIDRASSQVNDFRDFLNVHRAIRQIFFNGATAEAYFRRYVAATLDMGSIACRRLPSTSPAHAALRFEQKLAAWRIILAQRTLAG